MPEVLPRRPGARLSGDARLPIGKDMSRSSPHRVAGLFVLIVLGGVLSACGGTQESPLTLEVWAHDGTEAERRVLEEQVAAFDRAHDDVDVALTVLAEGDYNDAVQAAVASGDLPDVLEVDGPRLASLVYQGAVAPLDGEAGGDGGDPVVAADVLAAQIPSLQAQGTVDGARWAVGVFDSGLGLYADRAALRAAGVAWPRSAGDAWTDTEFTGVLAALVEDDRDGRVLDVKLNYGVGEWLTYGFAPLVASAGGSMIDDGTATATGGLDSPEVVAALRHLRRWSPAVDPNADDLAFVERRVALSWVGHWAYPDYVEALGEDLLVLPLPDLGNGTKTGQGSWAWSAGSGGSEASRLAAGQFLEFLLSTPEVLRMTGANGAVPGTTDALEQSTLYAVGGPLRLFADQLLASCGTAEPTPACVAVPRPTTPGYAVLTDGFAAAVAEALAGRDPAPALADAAADVARDLAAHGGYR